MTTAQTSLTAKKTMPKSIFASRTFWGAVLTLLVAIAPKVGEMVDTKAKGKNVDAENIAQLVVLLGTTTLTIMGRIDAKRPLYTPNGLPGSDKSDFQS